jgi:REP element-mobilizing transposase RayT
MKYPLAWFITWTTYGTWLHGDPRGSFLDKKYVQPDRDLEADMRSELAGPIVYLDDAQRAIVDEAIVKECCDQGWQLHERNVRTNHVHVIVSAARDGTFVRSRLKAIASDALSSAAGLPAVAHKNGRKRWWTEKGNIEALETDKELEELCIYVREMQ